MTELLNGKVAIVTGGASGIGLAAVRRFVAEGARVLIADIAEEAGVAVAAKAGPEVVFSRTDVTDEGSLQSAVDAAVDAFGRLDVMFNNAGSTGDSSGILELGTEGFDKTFILDVRSVILGHKLAGRRFRAQGSGGSIITNVSVAGLQGGWSSMSYVTAKHAVVGTIRQAAKELGEFGIRCNGVAPGVIMTPLLAKSFGVPPERGEAFIHFVEARLASRQAMGRYGTAEDIANAALFLASDLSTYVNGAVIPVDGGISSYTLSTSDAEVVQAAEAFLAAERDAG